MISEKNNREDGNKENVGQKREKILDRLEEVSEIAYKNIKKDEIEDKQKHHTQIKWSKTLAEISRQFRQLKKDEDIEKLEKEIELIRKANELYKK